MIQSVAVQNSVGARTEPCRTPVVVRKAGDSLPSFLNLEDVVVVGLGSASAVTTGNLSYFSGVRLY